MEDEKKEGFLRRTEGVTTVKASPVKPKKAKLTGKTIESLRTSEKRLARRIEKYNAQYQKLLDIATEISEKGEVKSEEVISDIEQFNKQAAKLAKLGVRIIAFEDLNNKIALNGVGIKAIKVPNRLTRLLNGFTKAGREKNAMYDKAEAAIEDIAKSVIAENEGELTVDITKLEGLNLTSPGTDLKKANLMNAPLIATLNYDYSLSHFLRPKETGYSLADENLVKARLFGVDPKAKYALSDVSKLFGDTPTTDKETDTDKKARLFGVPSKKPKTSDYGLSSFVPDEVVINKPAISVEDEGALVEIVSAQPSLFDALKAVCAAGYGSKLILKDEEKPAFMREHQRIAVVHGNAYVDTSNHPFLVNLINHAVSWGRKGKFTEEERTVFERTIAGLDVDLNTPELQKLADAVDYIKRLPITNRDIINLYEELSGNKVELPKPVVVEALGGYGLSEFVPDNKKEDEPGEKKEEPAEALGGYELSEFVPAGDTAPKHKKKESGVPSIFADPTEAMAEGFWKGTQPPADEEPLFVRTALEHNEERYRRELQSSAAALQLELTEKGALLLEKALDNNPTNAVRFILGEYVDEDGNPKFTEDKVMETCDEREITAIDFALETYRNLPPERRVAILNEITTDTFLQDAPVLEEHGRGKK